MKLVDLTPSKGEYLAFVLSDASRAVLLRSFPPKFSRVIAHHVTIEFKPTKDKLSLLSDQLGEPIEVEVYGYAFDDEVECVAVKLNGKKTRADGSFYHVTLSVEPPAKPVDSNRLKNHVHSVVKLKLAGEVRLIK